MASLGSSIVYGDLKVSRNVDIGNMLKIHSGGSSDYGVDSTPSVEMGSSAGGVRGFLKIHGYTAGQFGVVQMTTSNMHIDSGSSGSMYLNYYNGDGIKFGSGSNSIVAVMGADGDLWKGATDNSGSKYWHAGNDGSGSGLDADVLDGMQPTDAASVNTIMRRNSSGDTWCRLFRSTYSSTNSNIAGIYTTQSIGGDYMRPSTPTQVRNSMGLPKITTSTSAPSSPATNDIWIDTSA